MLLVLTFSLSDYLHGQTSGMMIARFTGRRNSDDDSFSWSSGQADFRVSLLDKAIIDNNRGCSRPDAQVLDLYKIKLRML